MVKKNVLLLLLILATATMGYPQFFGDSFSADPDITTRALYDRGMIVFTFRVPDSSHITDLKNGFFKIELEKNDFISLGEVRFPPGISFADEMVFRGKFDVQVRVRPLKEISEPVNVKFTVGYQICQEQPREVCFAPDSQEVVVRIEKSFSTPEPGENTDQQWIPTKGEVKKEGDTEPETRSFFQKIENLLTRELEKQSVLLFLLAFMLGFLTSLTPCVYPVIPIIMGYVGSQAKDSKIRGFYLSLFFVLGLGLVYSSLGVLAAVSGSVIGASFQNPVVVVVIQRVHQMMSTVQMLWLLLNKKKPLDRKAVS